MLCKKWERCQLWRSHRGHPRTTCITKHGLIPREPGLIHTHVQNMKKFGNFDPYSDYLELSNVVKETKKLEHSDGNQEVQPLTTRQSVNIMDRPLYEVMYASPVKRERQASETKLSISEAATVHRVESPPYISRTSLEPFVWRPSLLRLPSTSQNRQMTAVQPTSQDRQMTVQSTPQGRQMTVQSTPQDRQMTVQSTPHDRQMTVQLTPTDQRMTFSSIGLHWKKESGRKPTVLHETGRKNIPEKWHCTGPQQQLSTVEKTFFSCESSGLKMFDAAVREVQRKYSVEDMNQGELSDQGHVNQGELGCNQGHVNQGELSNQGHVNQGDLGCNQGQQETFSENTSSTSDRQASVVEALCDLMSNQSGLGFTGQPCARIMPMNSTLRSTMTSQSEQMEGSLMCNFCKTNGETSMFFKSHNLKDRSGKVSCPVLRSFRCPLCNSTGDNAHTVTYCPFGTGNASAMTAARTNRKSCGCRRETSRKCHHHTK